MIHPDLPERALSIQQPWAWLIVNRHKAIENRDWPTRFRGPVAIHAGKKEDKQAWFDLGNGRHPVSYEKAEFGWSSFPDYPPPMGGIVGVADVVDCVDRSDSDWFVGRYGFVLANQRPVPFIPVRGALGFFRWRDKL